MYLKLVGMKLEFCLYQFLNRQLSANCSTTVSQLFDICRLAG